MPRRLARAAGHLDLPRGHGRIDAAVVPDGRHEQHRLFVSSQPLQFAGDHELPTADDRRLPAVSGELPARGLHRPLLARNPPGEPRRLDPHPRGSRKPQPRRNQADRRHHETLRGSHFVDAGQRDKDGQRGGQPDRGRAIHDPLDRHLGEPLRGPTFERPHHEFRRLVRPRLHQHRVDDVVVKLGVVALDGPGRVNEVHPIEHQRQQPPHGRGDDRGHCHDQPRPADPGGQASGHQVVLEQHAAGEPEHQPDARRQQERRDRHALVVGHCLAEPFGEVAV